MTMEHPPFWRRISYRKWEFSKVMLVVRGVNHKQNSGEFKVWTSGSPIHAWLIPSYFYVYTYNVIRSRSNSVKPLIRNPSELIRYHSDTFGHPMPLIDWTVGRPWERMTRAIFVCSRDLQTSALCHGKMSQAADAAKARSVSGSSLIWGNLIWLDIYTGYWR